MFSESPERNGDNDVEGSPTTKDDGTLSPGTRRNADVVRWDVDAT